MTGQLELSALSIDDWQRQSLDAAAAVDKLQSRIEDQEPILQALVPEKHRFERLREEIRTCSTGPLARVPIGVKDIFHVDGMTTRAGSRLPAAELAGAEAAAVTALKRGGGVILGKTVSTEFAYFAPGPTRNPHDPAHTPGGSSSGSAAAVAAGYCPLALGTQTIGSISRPASFCGVVGFKPTHGRISLAGVIPLAPSLDHVGLFTTRVADAAAAAALCCANWEPPRQTRRAVLGIADGRYLERASPAGLEHYRAVCADLQSRGWEMRTAEPFDDFAEIEERHRIIMAAEFARVHRVWYPRFGDLYDARTRELIELGQSISQARLEAALEAMARFRRSLDEISRRAGIDLWLSPAATGPAPVGLDSTGDPVMSLPWTQAGVPTLSLPAGRAATGLPLGLQLAAYRGADEHLLQWGQELEEALGTWP